MAQPPTTSRTRRPSLLTEMKPAMQTVTAGSAGSAERAGTHLLGIYPIRDIRALSCPRAVAVGVYGTQDLRMGCFSLIEGDWLKRETVRRLKGAPPKDMYFLWSAKTVHLFGILDSTPLERVDRYLKSIPISELQTLHEASRIE